MSQSLSGVALRKDISDYKVIKAQNSAQKKHYRMEQIEKHANIYFNLYESKQLSLHEGDMEIFAEYIDTFGKSRKERLLDMLQTQSEFDVRKYLALSEQSKWQLFLNKQKNAEYFNAKKLNNKTKQYLSLHQETEDNLLPNFAQKRKINDLRAEANKYVKSFLRGYITIKPEDYDAFQVYIENLCQPIYHDSNAEIALLQLEELQKNAPSIAEAREIKPSIFARIKKNIVGKSAALKSAWNNLKDKFNSIKKQTLQLKPDYATNRSFIKTLAISGALFIGSLFLFKSASSSQDEKSSVPQNEIKAKETSENQKKTYDLSKQIVEKDVVKPNKSVNVKSHLQQKYDEFYDTKIEMLISAEQKQKLYKQIETKMKEGIFTLPEDISIKQLAYASEMHKTYGLKSVLDNVLKSDKTLTAAEQEKLENFAQTKSTTIRQKALQKHGKLTNYSSYDHADKKLQQRHVANLKQLKQLKSNQTRI